MATVRPTATDTIMSTDMVTAMTEAVPLPALYRLLTFLSPAFPIGAFTYSHGLEQVIDQGMVTNAGDLKAWLQDILKVGAGRSDAILLKESYRAALSGDKETVLDLRDLGLALQPSRERHLESTAQGTAFLGAVAKSWMPDGDTPASQLLHDLAAADQELWPYPVALGVVCAAHAIPEDAALASFLQAFATNLISVAVRAVPLGQTDGQTALADLEPVVFAVAKTAAAAGLDDLGTSTFLADIASMAHETQYSRLFRS